MLSKPHSHPMVGETYYFKDLFLLFLIVCVYVCLCGYVHISAGVQGDQRCLIPIELEWLCAT